MKINKKGVTRIVFEFKTIVVKIPNPTYSWHHFLKGLIGNINEYKTYKYNSGKYNQGLEHLLCPVLWYSWGGWVLIMPKADVLTDDQYINADLSVHELHFEGDNKSDNYGLLNNTIVKIDYGD